MQLITSKTLMRFIGIMLLGISIFNQQAQAQSYFERYSNFSGSSLSITGGLGTTTLFGDLDVHSISHQTRGLQANVGVSYRLTNYISLRGEGSLNRFYLERGNDNPKLVRHHNNLSTLSLNSALLFVHDLFPRTSIDRGQRSWNIYAFGGIGAAFFTPKNADTGELLRDLPPFENYAKIANTFPIGSGFEYFPVSYVGIGVEWQYVRTTTDLLDDMKPQRDNNTSNDSYFTIGFKVSYQIGGANTGGSVSGFNYSSYLKKSKKRAKYK